MLASEGIDCNSSKESAFLFPLI